MTFTGNAPVANANYSIASGANSNSPFITVFMTRDPNSSDFNYQIKTRWINTVTPKEWILISFNSVSNVTTANWIELSNGNSLLDIGVPNGTSPIFPDANGLINFTSTLGSITITGSAGGTGAQNINFDIQNYAKSVWTPTINGSTPGTTVYGIQAGSYVRLGSLLQAEFTVTTTSSTGTGNLVIGGLPSPINNLSNGNVVGSLFIASSLTWPASTTSISLFGSSGSSFLGIFCSGSGTAGGQMQIANTPMNIQGTIVYEI